MRTTKVGVLALAALALTAACGSDDDEGGGEGAATTAGGDAAVTTAGGDAATTTAGGDAATTTAGGGGGGGGYVIGVSNTLAGNGWREEMICAVKAESLASGDVSEVIAISKNGGPTEQIQDLQNLISQGVDAIVVNPSDREQLNPVIEEAIAQDIVVVAVDQAVTAEGAYVASNDQVAYGRVGAEWLAEELGGAGSVLYMRGIQGVPADTDRDTGFQEVMAEYPDIEVKEVFTDWDYTQGGDIAVQELTAADYDGIWTSGIDYTVVNAFDTVGKDPVPVVGADNNGFVKQLIDGTPGAAVTNPAVIGGVGTNIALQVLNGESPDQTTLLTPEVWDLENSQEQLESNYFEDRDDTFSSAVTIEGLTNFTPEQLLACKGPGE
ncbi:MAG: substrate-binding domain-containing protein [Ilumatobacteraceae bacterium]